MWSERDLQALKVLVFIVLTGAIILGAYWAIDQQNQQSAQDVEAIWDDVPSSR